MTEQSTPYGRLVVGTKEEIFAQAVSLAVAQSKKSNGRFSWALTGGNTPQEWYRWCVATKAIPGEVLAQADFTVSDERYVPLESDQSNFGHADRQLFVPLGLSVTQKIPWPVEKTPVEAAASYTGLWAARYGADATYDVCFLGMGDDAHTASVFPGSPLLKEPTTNLFTALDVPGKGWRLTITPAGLAQCKLIVISTLGGGKAKALAQIMKGPYDPVSTPSQLLKRCADRVVWLVDEAAAGALK